MHQDRTATLARIDRNDAQSENLRACSISNQSFCALELILSTPNNLNKIKETSCRSEQAALGRQQSSKLGRPVAATFCRSSLPASCRRLLSRRTVALPSSESDLHCISLASSTMAGQCAGGERVDRGAQLGLERCAAPRHGWSAAPGDRAGGECHSLSRCCVIACGFDRIALRLTRCSIAHLFASALSAAAASSSGDQSMESDVYESSAGIQVIPTFDGMGLKEELLRGIYAYGFEKPSAIQQRAIIPILKGRDVIAQSQSGTGKVSAEVDTLDLKMHCSEVKLLRLS
jgi:hypothetical protein